MQPRRRAEHGLFAVNELSASRWTTRAWHLPCCQPGNELADRSGRHSTPRGNACWCSTRGDDSPLSCCLCRGAGECAGRARQRTEQPERRRSVGCRRDGHLRVDWWTTFELRRRHVEGRRAAAIDRRGAMPARKDLGLRQTEHLGVGRLQRRVRRRAGRRSRRRRSRSRSSHVPNVGFLLFDGEKGQIYFRLFSYARYLNQRNLDESYVDAFGNTHDGAAAPGHPAAEVLRAVLGLVPDAEVPLLPLRLVVERVAGRSGAGRRRAAT